MHLTDNEPGIEIARNGGLAQALDLHMISSICEQIRHEAVRDEPDLRLWIKGGGLITIVEIIGSEGQQMQDVQTEKFGLIRDPIGLNYHAAAALSSLQQGDEKFSSTDSPIRHSAAIHVATRSAEFFIALSTGYGPGDEAVLLEIAFELGLKIQSQHEQDNRWLEFVQEKLGLLPTH